MHGIAEQTKNATVVVGATLQIDVDRLHADARELAETIASRLAKLEPEAEILGQVDRLRTLVVRLTGLVDDEGRAR